MHFVEIRVQFTKDNFTGLETTGFVVVFLELIGGTSAKPFNVTVSPLEQSPVSAKGNNIMYILLDISWSASQIGGVDFSNATLTATFASGTTMSNVSVPVRTDEVFEGSEEFDLRLNVPSSLGAAIQAGSRNTATGIIVDSDSKCLTV